MAETTVKYSANPLKARLSRYFRGHGEFCARHPWEVIVTAVTLTVSVLSIGVLSGGKVGTVCGLNKLCEEEEEASDVVLLAMINSLAVIYVYNQFSSLRKAGSKYLLSIAGLFTIFASFVFGSGVVNLIDKTASGISEALPFFLLLIDLSKARALANFAFRSRNKEEVLKNIGRGLSVLGPNMTLDTLVEVLLIGIGTFSGSRRLEIVCWFGAMSIIANFVVFMTFFPASLSLVMEVSPYDPTSTTWQLDELARDMQEEEVQKKPNPVVQRVKIIMALGLIFVHLHGWFLSGITGLSLGLAPQSSGEEGARDGQTATSGDDVVKIPLQDYLLWKAFNLSGDQIVTLALSAVLFVKYIFLDKATSFPTSIPPTPTTTVPAVAPPTDFTQVSACPIKLDGGAHLTVVRRRTTNSSSSTTYSDECPHTTEPVMSPPLPVVNGAIPTMNHVSTDISNGLGFERERVSEQLLALTTGSQREEKSFSSVGVQTVFEEERMFTLRQSSLSSSGSSGSSGVGMSVTEEVEEGERPPRPVAECLTIFQSEAGPASLSDVEVLQLVQEKHIPAYKLESALGDPERGVAIRRQLVSQQLHPDSASCLSELPYTNYDFSKVMGACCENVVGYMPVPVGVAGPLLLDGEYFHVPMATTEGALVASTNRGCRALALGGGAQSHLLGDGMTRGPVVRFPSAAEASQAKLWVENRDNFSAIAEAFNSTSGFARLVGVQTAVAGRLLYVRFKATTGDAMGMNMLSKGTERSLGVIAGLFPSMEVISLSGNFCTDKKPAAINWIEGRGKSVVCEATIPQQVVRQVLKTSVDALVDLGLCKNLVGSAMAGSVGGFNTHAANVVCAIFIATGQDPAQTVGSSNCITLAEKGGPSGEDLHISVTMPSLELGTVGGGTVLPAQAACLKMLGVQGPNRDTPGGNAVQLARVVCGAVLAGELSLMSALAAGHLVKSHLTHNRSKLNLLASIPETPPPPVAEADGK